MAEKYMGKYYIPVFDKEVELHFGYDYDETGWGKVEAPPTKDEINEYENTLKIFIENLNQIIESIKEEAFNYFKEVKTPYAKEFEEENSVKINDKEKHFEYIKKLYSVRIVKNKKVVLSIAYEIDKEHQMEILLKNNHVFKISEADETYFWTNE